MNKLDQLYEELELLRKQKQAAEETFKKKFDEFNAERERIKNNLPELFGVVLKSNTKPSKKLNAGEVYSLEYDHDMEPVFATYQRNYSESDTQYTHCPYCCKMKICTWDELTDEQRGKVIYVAYR